MISVFFEKLGSRLKNENHLSDITFAICESSNLFRKIFLDFFFENQIDYSHEVDIKREYFGINGARPDFRVFNNGNEFIIEVKIYDSNHHFEQYVACFPNASRGYICNYHIPNKTGYTIKTWKDLQIQLTKNITNLPEDNEKQLILGYVGYLRTICNISEIKKMNLSKVNSLLSFNELIKEIFNTPFKIGDNLITFSSNNQVKNYSELKYGLTFGIYRNNTRYVIGDPWFGIYFNTGLIYIGFPFFNHKDCAYHYFDNIESDNLFPNEFKYSKLPYEEDQIYWFEIIEDVMDEFNRDVTTLERQKEIAYSFFKEVIEILVLVKG
jgi:hypothetical protein